MSDLEVDRIRDAIAQTDNGDQLFVENFIVVATVTNPDGEGEIHTISDVDHAWQVLGMLHHALMVTEREKYLDDGTDA